MTAPAATPISDPRPSSLATYGAFFGCAAIWGSTFLFISLGNDTVPPLWAASIRLALAAVLLTVLARATGHGWPRGAALRAAAGFGFLNLGLSFCLLYWAETRVPSGLAAVLYATIPLSTALFARMFGLEPLRPAKIAGAIVALVGVAVIFRGRWSGTPETAGLIAVVVASLCAALSGIALKSGPRQNPLAANAAGAVVGLVVCIAGSFLLREDHALPRGTAAWVPILYLTIAGSIGAFGLYAWLVHRWPLTRVSFIAVVVPVVAVTLGALVRHERLAPATLGGSVLVLGGLLLGLFGDRSQAH